MPGSHNRFSPSGAERWMACPGSLSLPVPDGADESSPYAAEGTAAHELCQTCYMHGGDPHEFIGDTIEGFEVTEEMIHAVELYLTVINDRMKSMPGKWVQIGLEHRIVDEEWPDFGGTIDCLIETDEALAIVDFKYGQGIAVEATNNAQLMCYALLASRSRWNRGLGTKGPILLTIVQPRAHHQDGPVRTWECSPGDLTEFESRVGRIIEAQPVEFLAGDHCRWCPAKVNCPELHRYTLEMAQAEFRVDEMDAERATEILELRKALTGYLKAVEDWVHGQLDQGQEIPGYKLVEVLGNRRYNLDEEEIVRLCRNRKFGKKQIYEQRLLSPAQLEKVVGKELVSTMTHRPPKGTTVVPDTDKRPAVERLSATEEFAQE
jgi:hypothetical protein